MLAEHTTNCIRVTDEAGTEAGDDLLQCRRLPRNAHLQAIDLAAHVTGQVAVDP